MIPHGHFNVGKCVEYLRHVGIEVSKEQEVAWGTQETDFRAQRRANRRELQRSCGHFHTYWCLVHVAGGESCRIRYCGDCATEVERKPLTPEPPKRRKYA